jgi:hypothetical protein
MIFLKYYAQCLFLRYYSRFAVALFFAIACMVRFSNITWRQKTFVCFVGMCGLYEHFTYCLSPFVRFFLGFYLQFSQTPPLQISDLSNSSLIILLSQLFGILLFHLIAEWWVHFIMEKLLLAQRESN